MQVANACVVFFLLLVALTILFLIFFIRPVSSFILALLISFIVLNVICPVSQATLTTDWTLGVYTAIQLISFVILFLFILFTTITDRCDIVMKNQPISETFRGYFNMI